MRIQDAIVTMISYGKQPGKRELIREAQEFRNKTGLEIGGPTPLFGLKGTFPIYLYATKVDNVNYGRETFFGNYQEGMTYNYYRGKIGKQYIGEATSLDEIPDNSYDFILSSHSLEHTANPIKALKEWNRIVKPGGKLVLVLPDKRNTLDHKRAYTTFAHLLDDYNRDTTEHDTTHFDEILSTFDEVVAKVQLEEYTKQIRDNYANRCAHHHVFHPNVVKNALEYAGFAVDSQHEALPFHLIAIATKKPNH